MPWGLKRFHESRQLHFITFSCYHRQPKLASPDYRNVFEQSLEQTRIRHQFAIFGYVVMPEHVHLLLSEPEQVTLAKAVQSLKQSVARRLALRSGESFWQERYYDFNVWSELKRIEKLKYMHRNPVKRGLVAEPAQWAWGSFRHYTTGVDGVVEIESEWTARRRERAGQPPTVRVRQHP